MKVRNIYNKLSDIPINYVNSTQENETYDFTPGNEYVVYGITLKDGYVWYYICDDFNQGLEDSYPIIVLSFLFEVTDHRLSRYWQFNVFSENSANIEEWRYRWTFLEWSKEIYFYYNLMEFEKREQDIFLKWKKLIDLEFPNPKIIITANIGDHNWLMCPQCLDAWNWPSNRDALVMCPNCNTIMNNPRYSDK
jgi:hypothetical protein